MELNLSETFFFPEWMLMEVLSRLPVKSLLRFKCVCKSWRTLITSPVFISTHLKNYATTSLLVRCYDPAATRNVISLLSPTMKANWSAMDLDLPTILRDRGAFAYDTIHGPCNGIVCLGFNNLNQIALWNPATRDCHPVPLPLPTLTIDAFEGSIEFVYMVSTILGIGFDAKTNDYKVLRSLYVTNEEEEEVERGELIDEPQYFQLYSLRSNSWKLLQPTNITVHPWCRATRIACTVDGFICWVGVDIEGRFSRNIFSFDIKCEKFGIINLPPEIPPLHFGDYLARLVPFRESIALIHYDAYRHDVHPTVDIWVSETFPGGPWRRTWSLSVPLSDSAVPLALYEDGLFLYRISIKPSTGVKHGLVLYDPRTQETRQFGLGCRGMLPWNLVFRESLVAISSPDF